MKILFNPAVAGIYKPNRILQNKQNFGVNLSALKADTVSFGRNPKLLTEKEGKDYVNKYTTSTSGYRGVYGEDFNDKFVYTMTQAASKYMNEHKNRPVPLTLIGGDTREATKHYAPYISKLMRENGINVLYPQLEGTKGDEISPVASPVLAVAARLNKIPLSVLLTASHNPWKDGGYNFLNSDGMVAGLAQSDEIGNNILEITKEGKKFHTNSKKGRKIVFDPYKTYKKYVEERNLINFDNIKNAGIDIYYEDLGGTGKYYYPKLMSEHGIELKGVLSSPAEGPNPTADNLKELSNAVLQSDNPLRIGLATDGDSDRFGAVDENGNFIDTNDFILLTAYHLIKNKGMTQGTIVKNHSTSDRVEALAKYFNAHGCDIDVNPTPVGFKYLGGEMTRLEGTPKEIILAGESSGGLTVRNHLPEKDGFVAISNLADLVATEKKPLSVILKEINSLIDGEYKSLDINVKFKTEEEKMRAVNSFLPYAQGNMDEIYGYKIDKERTIAHNEKMKTYRPGGDGCKIYLQNNTSILVRKSGTEPIMRYFIDSQHEEVLNDLKDKLSQYAQDCGGSIIG